VEYQKGMQSDADIDFTGVDFVEVFNVTADPEMMHNTFNNSRGAGTPVGPAHDALRRWLRCAGAACP